MASFPSQYNGENGRRQFGALPDTTFSYGDLLNRSVDSAISEWNHPRVWSKGCGHQECIGSRAELAERSGRPEAAEIELHRPYIDEVTFTCPDYGVPQ